MMDAAVRAKMGGKDVHIFFAYQNQMRECEKNWPTVIIGPANFHVFKKDGILSLKDLTMRGYRDVTVFVDHLVLESYFRGLAEACLAYNEEEPK